MANKCSSLNEDLFLSVANIEDEVLYLQLWRRTFEHVQYLCVCVCVCVCVCLSAWISVCWDIGLHADCWFWLCIYQFCTWLHSSAVQNSSDAIMTNVGVSSWSERVSVFAPQRFSFLSRLQISLTHLLPHDVAELQTLSGTFDFSTSPQANTWLTLATRCSTNCCRHNYNMKPITLKQNPLKT